MNDSILEMPNPNLLPSPTEAKVISDIPITQVNAPGPSPSFSCHNVPLTPSPPSNSILEPLSSNLHTSTPSFPSSSLSPSPSPESISTLPTSTSTLEPNWKPIKSKTGSIYYFNQLTFETRWHAPILSTSPNSIPAFPPRSTSLKTEAIPSTSPTSNPLPLKSDIIASDVHSASTPPLQTTTNISAATTTTTTTTTVPFPSTDATSTVSNFKQEKRVKQTTMVLNSSINSTHSDKDSISIHEMGKDISQTRPKLTPLEKKPEEPSTGIEKKMGKDIEEGKPNTISFKKNGSLSNLLSTPDVPSKSLISGQPLTPPTTATPSPNSPEFKPKMTSLPASNSSSHFISSHLPSDSTKSTSVVKKESIQPLVSSSIILPESNPSTNTSNPKLGHVPIDKSNPPSLSPFNTITNDSSTTTTTATTTTATLDSTLTSKRRQSLLPPLSFLPFSSGDSFSNYLISSSPDSNLALASACYSHIPTPSEQEPTQAEPTALSSSNVASPTDPLGPSMTSPLQTSASSSSTLLFNVFNKIRTPPTSFAQADSVSPSLSSSASSTSSTSSASSTSSSSHPLVLHSDSPVFSNSVDTSPKLESATPKSGFTRFFKSSKPSTSSSSTSSSHMDTSFTSTISSAKASFSSESPALFGGALSDLILEDTLPSFVVDCLRVLEEKGPEVQGIYRISGNASMIQRVKQMCLDHHPIPWETLDIHVISGALKLFFRELKEPLFPFAFYTEFVNAGKLKSVEQRISMLDGLVKKLPKPHRLMLVHLLMHLNKLTKAQELTKMDASNLSIVFGPTLLRPQLETMEMMLNTDAQNQVVKDLILEVDRLSPGWLASSCS